MYTDEIPESYLKFKNSKKWKIKFNQSEEEIQKFLEEFKETKHKSDSYVIEDADEN